MASYSYAACRPPRLVPSLVSFRSRLSFEPMLIVPQHIARALVAHTQQTWRWCYYLNLITSCLCVLLYVFFYHPPRFHLLHTKHSKWEEFKRIDFGGLVLFTAGLLLLLLGLSWGGQSYPWKSVEVIATMTVGGACLIALGFYGKQVLLNNSGEIF